MSPDNESRDIQGLLQQAYDGPSPEPRFVQGLGERLAWELSSARGKSVPLQAHAPRPRPWRWLLLTAAAAAIVLVAVAAYFLRQWGGASFPEKDMEIGQMNPKVPDDKGVSEPPPPTSKESLMEMEGPGKRLTLRERSLEQRVADAQVIVVATALDWAPAPPNRPGDLPEVLIRFQVTRVLKGKLAEKVITTRTPTAADEFIGKEWVILLSPEYLAGKHQFADCSWIKAELEVKAILAKTKK